MASDESNKKTSFLDRLSGKVSEGFKPNPGDIIHEGISDDELDKLLSADIKSTSRPPTNPSGPAEYSAKEMDGLSTTFVDAITEDQTDKESGSESAVSVDSDKTQSVSVVSNDALNSALTTSNTIDDSDIVETSAVDLTSEHLVDAALNAEAPTISISGIGATSASFNRKPGKTDAAKDMDAADTLDMIDSNDELVFTPSEDAAKVDVNVDTDDSMIDFDSKDGNSVVTSDLNITSNEDDDAQADVKKTDDLTASATDSIVKTMPFSGTQTDEKNGLATHDIQGSTNSSDTPTDEKTSSTPVTTSAETTKKSFITPSTSGNKTMTDINQNNLVEKVQTDIDELKRKIHAMSTEYFTAATDSATLLGQIRELDTGSSDDYSGTYNQTRALRKLLIDARKLFTELPSTLDMLEEALENDLYTAKK